MQKDRIMGGAKILATLVFIGGLLYLASQSVFSHLHESDFRFVWLAGHFWAAGIDPYSSDYISRGREFFPTGNDIAYWLYPPQWWFICRPLAVLTPPAALVAWRSLNAVLVLLSAGIMFAGLRVLKPATPLWLCLPLIAYACVLEATAQTLSSGQTSIIILLGLSLASYAICTQRSLPMVAALVLCGLKPQIGVLLFVALIAQRRWWPAIMGGALISAALTIPQIAQFGLAPTLHGFLFNLSMHGQLAPNQPANLTGIVHLAWSAGLKVPEMACIGVAILAALALSIGFAGHAGAEHRALMILGIVAIIIFLLPLHDYDFVLAAPLAFFLWPLRRGFAVGLAIVAVVMLRAGNLGAIIARPFAALLAKTANPELVTLSIAGAGAFVLVALAIATVKRRGSGIRPIS